MSIKLKALGLGLLAVMATTAFTVMNASATTPVNSHFVAHPNEHHVILTGTEEFDPNDPNKKHNLTFQRTVNGVPNGDPIKCTHVAYHGTLTGAAATTTQSVSLRPDYTAPHTNCSTKGTGPHNVTIDVPAGCGTEVFQFTSGNPGTVHVKCVITVTHPSCEITIPVQTLSGVTYKADVKDGKSSITAEVNVNNITGHFHAGICVFLGTNQTFHMVGSVTVWGENTNAEPVGITHTP